MNSLRYAIWIASVIVPILFFAVGRKHDSDRKAALQDTRRHYRSDYQPRHDVPVLKEIRKEDRSLDHLKQLLFEDEQLVPVRVFEDRLLKSKSDFDPKSKGYEGLLLSAYVNAILRYEELTGSAKYYSAVASAIKAANHSATRHLVKAAEIYGLSEALSIVGGIRVLNSNELNQFIAESSASSISMKELVSLLAAEGVGSSLEDNAIKTIIAKPSEDLPEELKWSLLNTIEPGDGRTTAIHSLAAYLAASGPRTGLPSAGLTDPKELNQFQSAFARAVLDIDFPTGLRLIEQNEILNNQEMHLYLKKSAAALANTDLPELSRLIDQTNQTDVKDSLRHGQLNAWANFDPLQAARFAAEGLGQHTTNLAHLATAMHDWFQTEPTKALHFAESLNLDPSELQGLIAPYLPEIARNTPDTYNHFVNSQHRSFPQAAIRYLIEADLEISDEHALKRIDLIESKQDRFSAYTIASDLIASKDLQQAINHAAQVRDPDKRDALILGTLSYATNADLQLSQKLIEKISQPKIQFNAYRTWLDHARRKEPELAIHLIESTRHKNPDLYKKLIKKNP